MSSNNRHCFVPNCKSGYRSCKEKVSMFHAPKDQELFVLWTRAIPRSDKILSAKDSVCAKHFAEDDIIRGWKSGDISFPYLIPRLSKTAVPTIFPDCPSYLTKKLVKKRRGIVKHPIVPRNIQAKQELPCSYQSLPEINETTDDTNLFQKLVNNDVELKFPNSSWALHSIRNDFVCLSEIDVTKNGSPLTLRQIVINKNLELKFFIGCKEILEIDQHIDIRNAMDSIENLQNIINIFQNISLSGWA